MIDDSTQVDSFRAKSYDCVYKIKPSLRENPLPPPKKKGNPNFIFNKEKSMGIPSLCLLRKRYTVYPVAT